MQVNYTAKANSDIRIVASLPENAWQVGDVDVAVQGFRSDDTVVIAGTITIYVSEKPQR
jgi:hypothetical protein